MPRPSSIKPNTQKQSDQRDFYDWTTPGFKVSANPVDPYARPGAPPQVQMSGDVKAFQNIMGDLQGALQGGIQIKKNYDKAEGKRGAADSLKGVKDPNAGEAYLTAHEIVSGKAAAADLETATAEYYEKNKDEDALTFKAGMERLHKQFLNGRSEAFTEGILSDAIGIEQKYGVAYHAYTVKKVKDEGLAKLGKGFDYDINTIAADTTTTRDDKAKAVREMITGMQMIGKMTYGLSNNEVSDHAITIMRRKSIELADPDLMKFAWVPDSKERGGIRIIDNPKLAADVESAVKAAETERTARSNDFDKLHAKMQKEVTNRVANKINELLLDSNVDTKEAYELLHTYSDPSRNKEAIMLSPAEVEHGYRLIATRGAGFALQSDSEKFQWAMEKAGKGELTMGEIRGLKRYLEEGEWKSILSMNIREQNSGSGGGASTEGRKDFEAKLATAVAQVKALDPHTGRYLDPHGPKRATFVTTELRDRWAEYKTANKGAEPPRAEVNKWIQASIADAWAFYQNTDASGNVIPPPAAAAPVKASSKPALDNQSGPKMKTDVGTDLGARFDALEAKRKKK